jgi:hypothetical protein
LVLESSGDEHLVRYLDGDMVKIEPLTTEQLRAITNEQV